jgi:tRNA threonylcarbamoyladenosine biosynthesis protein TsaB
MRTIAIDTSHAAGSVVARSGLAVASRALGVAGEHAGRLAAALAEVTAELGWTLADAELVAVVRGPGSFTGLRVGVATAKAVAWAGGAALVGVSGFEVVALETARLSGWGDAPLAIAYDAGRGEVFAAVATPTSSGHWRVTPGVLQPADRWIASLAPGSRLTGPALASLADRLQESGHLVAPTAAWVPTAGATAELALVKARAGAADSPASLVPEYLRPSYAEEK